MRTIHILAAAALIGPGSSWCQGETGGPPPSAFVAGTIPVSLLKGANAVIRYEDCAISVRSRRKATYTIHRVTTVLNAEGRDAGELFLYYDRFHEVDGIEARVFDATGKEIRSLRSDDVKDYDASAGALYEDMRVRYATIYHGAFPYTVETIVRYVYDGYLSWPDWYPERYNKSVEYSRFSVTLPPAMKLRHVQTFEAPPTSSVEGGTTTYVWEARNLVPFDPEPVGPPLEAQYRYVRVAPDEFELEDKPGSFASWNSFGRWYYDLYRERQTLPPEAHQVIRDALAGATSRRDSIRQIYDLLQDRTRYISIQLGIGGWQPFPASFVYEKGYGDCKGLSNYMMAMLDVVGITACPVIIENAPLPTALDPSFPYNPFNHVILCVPDGNDSLWLECTSQSIPFGHIGYTNENRYALLVGPAGGALVRTPSSQSGLNCQLRRAAVALTTVGLARATISTTFTGDQQDYVRRALVASSPKERDTWVRNHIAIGVFEIRNADFSGLSGSGDTVSLAFTLDIPRLASVAGSRLLFQPNMMERRYYVPKPIEKRRFPVMHTYPYLDIDSITYTLPNGYHAEALPGPVDLSMPFARYHAAIVPGGEGTLIYSRWLEITASEIPATQYGEYRRFLELVAKADKASAALVRN